MNTSSWIKILACVFMALDHIGAYLLPELGWLRIIGRLAFPLFAYGVVQGFFLTHNFEAYAKRLFVLAAVWQVFHAFLIYAGYISSYEPINVIFTLLCGLYCIAFIEGKMFGFAVIFFLYSILMDVLGIGFQYGSYGVALVISCYFLRFEKYGIFVLFALSLVLSFASFGFGKYSIIQLFAPFAFLLLLIKFPDGPKINKHFYYLFYPVHLLIIMFIRYYSNTIIILQ